MATREELFAKRQELKKYSGLIRGYDDSVLFLKSDGEVVAFGDNGYGRLNVNAWSGIEYMQPGYTHSIGLTLNGKVVSTKVEVNGSDRVDHGQWDITNDFCDITSVASNGDFTVGAKKNGSVVCTRWRDSLLDLSDSNNVRETVSCWSNIKEVVANSSIYGIKYNGTVVSVGDSFHGECEGVDAWRNIERVYAGTHRAIGLKTDGTVVSTRWHASPFSNKDTETYDGMCDVSGWTDIVDIATGSRSFTVGLRADGTVVVTKYLGKDGRCKGLDKVSEWTDIVAISAGYQIILGLKHDGTVVSAGNVENCNYEIPDWKDVVGVYTTGDCAFAVTSNGTVLSASKEGDIDVTDLKLFGSVETFDEERQAAKEHDAHLDSIATQLADAIRNMPEYQNSTSQTPSSITYTAHRKEKTARRSIPKIIIGAYLAVQGGGAALLGLGATVTEPENPISLIMLGVGAAFLIGGALLFFNGIKKKQR